MIREVKYLYYFFLTNLLFLILNIYFSMYDYRMKNTDLPAIAEAVKENKI